MELLDQPQAIVRLRMVASDSTEIMHKGCWFLAMYAEALKRKKMISIKSMRSENFSV